MTADLPPPTPRPRHSAVRKSKMPRRPSGLAVQSGGRRWPRRLAIGAGALVIVLIVIVGGIFFYARYRFGQIHKSKVVGLTPAVSGQPFDILLVGSDSRAFVDTSGEASQFGAKSATSGQRSDVIIVARIDPVTRSVRLLSIPRDTWVDIPGSATDISGPNRINAAFNSGPSLLVETIKKTFGIPITYYAEVNFPGFSGMVNALGGINLNFSDPVRDNYSGLDVTTTGCQVVHGAQALALVRSRHLYYYSADEWNYDGDSDFSRIQRQDAFFRALVAKLRGAVTNPLTLNDFLGSATKYVTIDQTLSEGELVSLAKIFRSFTSAELATETLPTAPVTISGQDVLIPAVAADEKVIDQFLAFGTTTTTTAALAGPPPRPGQPALLSVTKRATLVSSSPGATVTTVPGSPVVSPSQVNYNTEPEPWNPVPCS